MLDYTAAHTHTLRQKTVFDGEGCLQRSLMIHDLDWYKEIIIVDLLHILACYNHWLLEFRLLQTEDVCTCFRRSLAYFNNNVPDVLVSE